ncbi:MAG: 3-phosphoshikimate 1-carboxyvinyltransferase [Maricaulis sp.]|jgi:3-phosphoshikimate 1-carboxyvinyltransferase
MTQLATQLQGPFLARPSGPLSGTLKAPADKSISHRALIFASLAFGESEITGLLESADVLNTARAVAALGARVERLGPGHWRVTGTAGRFATPREALDFGNSGTGVRLMMGAIAGSGAGAVFTGDASLSARPMRRVTDPLEAMGAHFTSTDGRLPVTLQPSKLHGIAYAPPIASAQVKSALLLAGLGATGETVITEHHATRDHTETMLRAFGVTLDVSVTDTGVRIRLPGQQSLTARDINVPGDPSSIGFALVAALILPGSSIHIAGVMDNPSRTGLIETLKQMGADLEIAPGPQMAGERTMNITASYSLLRGVDVPASRAPSMIDEYPVLGVAAAFASGTTRMAGLAELKAKESDRLAGTADLLQRNGVAVEAGEDSLTVHGKGPGSVRGGGMVATHHDHRLAMSALVLGLAAQQAVSIDDAAMIATSYPGFADDMKALGATLEPV